LQKLQYFNSTKPTKFTDENELKDVAEPNLCESDEEPQLSNAGMQTLLGTLRQ